MNYAFLLKILSLTHDTVRLTPAGDSRASDSRVGSAFIKKPDA